MATKKYLSLDRLTEYDALIKQEIADSVSGKSDSGHTHDDRYYTETEINSKLSTINTSISNITSGTTPVKEAEHAESADTATNATNATHATSADSATTATSATKATQDGNGKVIADTYETKTDASAKLAEAKTYTDTVAAGKSDTNHNHDDKYDAKGAAATAESNAKTYADTAVANLLENSTEAVDSIYELRDAMNDNADAIEALQSIAAGKADATHDHEISEVNGLQSALDGKAPTSHGTHVSYSTTAPLMDGTASAGSASTVARSDHKHPTDTSRASQTALDEHDENTTKHITSTERTNWNAAKTHADSAHAPSNAQANVIESIKVNGTAQTITSKSVDITVPTDNSQLANGAGYITSSAITNKADKSTTLAGYGITNAYTKTEVDAKTVVDTALSSTSTNAVQNKVVNSAIVTATSAISANTASIDAHTTRISALETKVGDGFEEITSAEIQALFA